jgi:hypothetical protein
MRVSILLALVSLSLHAAAQDPVISEFLADNDKVLLDVDGDSSDWIEIYNPGGSAIDLGGWHLTDDDADPLKWTIPSPTWVAPDGFLVIFASSKDRTNPLEELHTNFKLSRSGEYLALYNPAGTVASTEFTPNFPEQFEDVSYGFEFNPFVTQNAYYFYTPTPGAINESPGPYLADIESDPREPGDNDTIVISVRILGLSGGPATVQLVCQVMYQQPFVLPMLDDGVYPDAYAGDDIYAAAIPATASAPGEMVRWAIIAMDGNWNSAREPPFLDPLSDPQYLGTIISDPSIVTPQRIFHWFVENPNAANTDFGTRCSLWFEGRFYDNCKVKRRGASSAYYPKKSYKFDFNNGDRFFLEESGRRVDEVNLNTTWADKAYVRQTLCFDLYEACGASGGISYMVRLEQNGDFFSVCAFVEEPDEDLLVRCSLDPEGALYKMYNTCISGTHNVEKVTRLHEDHSDLVEFVAGVQLSNPDRREFVFDAVDIPAVISYLAATAIMFDNDHVHKNYFLYRDSDGDGEWRFLPWDKDLTLGRNYTLSGGVLNDTMFATQDPFCHPLFGDRFHQKNDNVWNRLIDAMYSQPDIVEMYARRLRTLMDEYLQAPGTPAEDLFLEGYTDQMVADLAADVALDEATWGIPSWGSPLDFAAAINQMKVYYFVPRRTHFYVTHLTSSGGIIPDAAVFATVYITHIEGDPASGVQDEEYITLHNPNSFAVDMSGWTLSGGVDSAFDPGTVIVAGGVVFVSPDLATFRARATGPSGGQELFVVGPYDGHVSFGEEVVLSDQSGRIIFSKTFGSWGGGTSYCFGDGSGTPCPCGNPGSSTTGCANSTGSGASIAGAGSPSTSSDDLALQAEGMLPNQPGLLFVGLNAVDGGFGTHFGDGLRCAGGAIIRLGVRMADGAGTAQWGPGLAGAGGWSSGDLRRFQLWYRDPGGSPCGNDFNLSNGVAILFEP